MAPEFRELSDQEDMWLQAQLRNATSIVLAFTQETPANLISLEQIDRAYTVWFEQRIEDGDEINAAINACAAVLGENLVRYMGYEWGVLTDSFGTQIALRGQIGAGVSYICPIDFVAKRWHHKETGFFSDALKVFKTANEAAIKRNAAQDAAQNN